MMVRNLNFLLLWIDSLGRGNQSFSFDTCNTSISCNLDSCYFENSVNLLLPEIKYFCFHVEQYDHNTVYFAILARFELL